MTLFEVGIVVAVVMVLAILLLPALANARRKSSKIRCVNNLKQIGLAYKIWETDNGDIFPMGISATNGGSMEMVAKGNVVQTFLVMSNELGTPKILFCPSDAGRSWANTFSGLSARNISYFVGADATNDLNDLNPIISGDCNFELGGKPIGAGLNSFWTNDPVTWSPTTRHMKSGNIGLADGSVQSTTASSLRNYFQQTGLATNRFAVP